MQVQETILFLAVAALAAALIIAVVAPRLRGGSQRDLARPVKEPSAKPAPSEAPARRSPTGHRPALEIGGPLAVAGGGGPVLAPPPPPVHMICPTCRRQFAAGLRYCPYDARVLTADLHQPGRPTPPPPGGLGSPTEGKICPNCARRYDAVALVCGRDGTALVSVN